MNSLFPTVGVCGTGAMGQGIAQLAAQAGSQVMLFDASFERAEHAQERYCRAMAKNACQAPHLHQHQLSQYLRALNTANTLQALSSCDLVIEAIVEECSDVKQALFAQLCEHLLSRGRHREQHVLFVHHGTGCRHASSPAFCRLAFFQSRRFNEGGGGSSWFGNVASRM
jgi:glycerol-3-phosphate dehydrogenase